PTAAPAAIRLSFSARPRTCSRRASRSSTVNTTTRIVTGNARDPPFGGSRSSHRCGADSDCDRLLLGLRDDPDVGLGGFPVAEDLFGFVVGDRSGDDHV